MLLLYTQYIASNASQHIFKKSLREDMFIDLRERETSVWETDIDQVPPWHAPTGDQTHNLAVCPNPELNLYPFGVWDDAPSEPHWPGLSLVTVFVNVIQDRFPNTNPPNN